MSHACLCTLAIAAALAGAQTSFAQQQPSPPANTKQPDNSADPFSMDLDSLANVKVTTASKFSQNLIDAPAVMVVVSQDDIKRFGGTTLAEILDRVPGLNLSSGAEASRTIITIDGEQSRRNGGHVLILINGRPIREVAEGGDYPDILESFPVNALERIEIIKGPGSVLYGSDAFSGVINLITKKATVGETVALRAAGGASGAAETSSEVLFARGGVNVMAAAQYHQFPRWNAPYSFSASPFEPQAFIPNADIPNASIGAYLGLNYKGLSFNSSYTAYDSSSFLFGRAGTIAWKKGFLDLGYSLKVSPKWDMNFNLTDTREYAISPVVLQLTEDGNQLLGEWTNIVSFTEKDKLTFGTTLSHMTAYLVDVAVTPHSKVDDAGLTAGSFYAQDEHRLTDDLKLIGGFQANKIGRLALNVVPRLGLVWNPASRIALKVLYSGAFRAPSVAEATLNYPAFKGDPNLLPEQIGTLNLQAVYQRVRLQSEIGYFHSRETNLIYENYRVFPGVYANSKSPIALQGIDWDGKYFLRKDWQFVVSALYQRSHDEAGPNVMPIPAFSAKAGVSYIAENGFDVSLFDSYRGHLPGYSAAVNPLPAAFHSVNAHFRFDLTKRWHKSDATGLAVFVHANNVTNRQIWLPALGSLSANNDTVPFSRGRTLFYGIEIWQKKPE